MKATPSSKAPSSDHCKNNSTPISRLANSAKLQLRRPPVKDVKPVPDLKWYAIYTKSRFEKKIHKALQKSGFQTFLPLIKEKRVWSDRIKTVEVPLFPSDVFINAAKVQFPQIYLFPGFVRFISFEGKPCEIKEKEIHLIEKIITHGFPVQQTACCQVGDLVRIIRGPLKGWEGRVESKKGNSRIVFHFEGLQQAISVEVGMGDVEKIVV